VPTAQRVARQKESSIATLRGGACVLEEELPAPTRITLGAFSHNCNDPTRRARIAGSGDVFARRALSPSAASLCSAHAVYGRLPNRIRFAVGAFEGLNRRLDISARTQHRHEAHRAAAFGAARGQELHVCLHWDPPPISSRPPQAYQCCDLMSADVRLMSQALAIEVAILAPL
jgi:hypothetical protein